MIITGEQIKEYVKEGKIVIDPFDEKQINPNSYNVRLHSVLKVYDKQLPYLDAKADNPTNEIIIPEEGYVIKPGTLYLGRTVEYTETMPISENDALVICIDGRSSLARLGVSCHISAGYGDIGFKGTFTCEISCVHPVKIYPNMLIGQIYYVKTFGNTDIIYHGKYQGQIDATKSKFFVDADK